MEQDENNKSFRKLLNLGLRALSSEWVALRGRCRRSRLTRSECCLRAEYHTQFPKDSALRKIWIKAIGRPENWEPRKNTRICSKHFERSCFRKTLHNSCLYPLSVPTLKFQSSRDKDVTQLLQYTQDVDLDNTFDIQLLQNTQDVDLDNTVDIQLLQNTQDVDLDNKDDIQLLQNTQDVDLDNKDDIQLLQNTQEIMDKDPLLQTTQDNDLDNIDNLSCTSTEDNDLTNDVDLDKKEDTFMVIGTHRVEKESDRPATSVLVKSEQQISPEILQLRQTLQQNSAFQRRQSNTIKALRAENCRLLKKNASLSQSVKKLESAPAVVNDREINILRKRNQQLQEKNLSLVEIMSKLKSKIATNEACASVSVCKMCGSSVDFTK